MQKHKCYTCQRNNIKLFRPYGEFLRDETIFCALHIPAEKYPWYIALVEDDDGSVWGYTSIPAKVLERWRGLKSY